LLLGCLAPLFSAAMALCQERNPDELGFYRGFSIDFSAVRRASDFATVEASVQHQIDIVADSGAALEIMRFFRSREIVLKPGLERTHGGFNGSNVSRVLIEDKAQPPQQPIVLHELLHAYHFAVMPGGFRNPDVLTFYDRAKSNQLYPANEYVLRNPQEFFAVTGSLYLWGHVDRAPSTREKLKAAQPTYYGWLARLFGVEK
jgi:hypothetical protein